MTYVVSCLNFDKAFMGANVFVYVRMELLGQLRIMDEPEKICMGQEARAW